MYTIFKSIAFKIHNQTSRLFPEQTSLKQTSKELLPSCKTTGFKKLSDLRHHQHSHEAPRFFCPARACKAQIRGFKRKDNLTDHQKRVHEANARASVVASQDSKPSA
ncbi:uncharacterized protein EAF01_005273 [Botrytis porri]|uniref:uncharacterized protein n=1 Tax=Botrytis porri TaxID=87229 RepID=UPI0019020180|nr:uncharacterized protein EAF01_005273 [Botrytis porri]KAF7907687.1 hypothetical protein EAF01_005273 [Botrytis porri]